MYLHVHPLFVLLPFPPLLTIIGNVPTHSLLLVKCHFLLKGSFSSTPDGGPLLVSVLFGSTVHYLK